MKEIVFDLPEERIAKHPTPQRDGCKLLVYHHKKDMVEHRQFSDVTDYLQDSDHVVFNHAKVSPKRVYWVGPSKRKHEIVFLKLLENDEQSCSWEVILSGKKLKEQQVYEMAPGISFRIVKKLNKLSHIQVLCSLHVLNTHLEEHGLLPLPPYILKSRQNAGQDANLESDNVDYQTVFASKAGASAAPTAGLHFTNELLEKISQMGVTRHEIFLEVGWGTFAPLTPQNFSQKKLHEEYIEISQAVATAINQAKKTNQRVIGVGTTVARSLESWGGFDCPEVDFHTMSDLFIYPPYEFTVVDGLITNFHLPGSSLLLLVAAFLGQGGQKKILEIYNEAIKHQYRFYSYGDAMLII